MAHLQAEDKGSLCTDTRTYPNITVQDEQAVNVNKNLHFHDDLIISKIGNQLLCKLNKPFI
jgi:hypothetical protein